MLGPHPEKGREVSAAIDLVSGFGHDGILIHSGSERVGAQLRPAGQAILIQRTVWKVS